MRLFNLDPVTVKTTPEEEAYIRKYLEEDTVLVSRSISSGPEAIESEYTEALAQPEVIKLAVEAEKEGYDGIFINCFGDPGVRAARECVRIPVFGGFEPVMNLALGLGDQIGIITVLDSVLPMIKNNIKRAGIGERVVSVRTIDTPVLELGSSEKLVEKLVAEAIAAIEKDGAHVIVLGCTAMIDVAEKTKLALERKGFDVPVLEGAQSALMLLELYVKMGFKHSKLTYAPVQSGTVKPARHGNIRE